MLYKTNPSTNIQAKLFRNNTTKLKAREDIKDLFNNNNNNSYNRVILSKEAKLQESFYPSIFSRVIYNKV